MTSIVRALFAFAVSLVRSRVSLQVEILALRHQLGVYHRSIRRPQVRPIDRIVWSWLSRAWARWRDVLIFVQPATVLAWQRTRFRAHWGRLSRRGPGRPTIPTVEKYRVRPRRPASLAWRTFLKTHVMELVALDFFTVPTVDFNVLFVLVIVAHARRKVVHFNVTAYPTARWTAQQLVEAFPWDTTPQAPPPRSRCRVWRMVSAARDQLGDGASAHGPAESLAEGLCFTLHLLGLFRRELRQAPLGELDALGFARGMRPRVLV
jgi:hypothetical protein